MKVCDSKVSAHLVLHLRWQFEFYFRDVLFDSIIYLKKLKSLRANSYHQFSIKYFFLIMEKTLKDFQKSCKNKRKNEKTS